MFRPARVLAMTAALLWGVLGHPGAALAQDEPIPQPDDALDASTFDETLSPYGQWVDTGAGPNDGRAWRPDPDVVGEDFQPYATGGRWVYSDWGWTWESDYAWGWAPFHYGRWALTPSWGWVWYPGTVWAPAWVDWRFGGGYIGWAPLPPVGYAVVVQPWRPYWCFVPSNVFIYNDVWAYRLPVDRIHAAYAATVPVHQAVTYGRARWYSGPPAPLVEHSVGRPVPRIASGFTPPAPGRIQPVYPGGRLGAPTPRPVGTVGSPVTPRPYGTPAQGWRTPSTPSTPYRGPAAGSPAPRSSTPAPSAPASPPTSAPRPRSLGYWSPPARNPSVPSAYSPPVVARGPAGYASRPSGAPPLGSFGGGRPSFPVSRGGGGGFSSGGHSGGGFRGGGGSSGGGHASHGGAHR